MSKSRKPAYTLHKPSGQARVRVKGKDHYLGLYDSSESKARYQAILEEWTNENDCSDHHLLTIDELAIRYIQHAKKYYRKNDKETSEVHNIRLALRPLVSKFGHEFVHEFGPLKLKQVRQRMIENGNVRTSINRQISRIKGMFGWAAENELASDRVHSALIKVTGLRRGRTDAQESDPVKPVPEAFINAIQPHVSSQVWAMVQLQILTGMRPGEVRLMRGCDLNMSGRIWEYVPESHKTEHHGRARVIFLGPRAQVIVREFLKSDLQSYLFSPIDAKAEFYAIKRENRKTPITPSQRARKRKANPERSANKCYSLYSYRQAVIYGCENAFGMPNELRRIPKDTPAEEKQRRQSEAREWRKQHCWHPHQLRHNAGTTLRREFGIEAARTVLGHASSAVTEVYAEMDLDKARSIIGKIG